MTEGDLKLDWAASHMDVLGNVEKKFIEEKPFKDLKIGMALHVEAKTGVLALTLKKGGAEVSLASCNPLTSDDEVVSALKDRGIKTYAKYGETKEQYYENLNKVLDAKPDIIIDDGGDLTYLLHSEREYLIKHIIGGNEETTTGVVRLKAMEKKSALRFPMFDVNDAMMKHLFDNRYGTGQSTMDGLFTSLNLLIAGKNIVVAGYGWCGRGIAMRLKGLGATVTVTEIDPIKAIEARLDGFQVARMEDAIKDADLVITATGMKDVVRKEHMLNTKKECILANSGHFDNEVSKNDLCSLADKSVVREYVEEFSFNGKKINLLADGRLVNLVAGQGHPVEIMDMSFAIQALTAEYIVKNSKSLENKVYSVPAEIDEEVAWMKLKSLNIKIDELNDEQKRYLEEWGEGT